MAGTVAVAEEDGSQGKPLLASSLSTVPSCIQAPSDSLIACPGGILRSRKKWYPLEVRYGLHLFLTMAYKASSNRPDTLSPQGLCTSCSLTTKVFPQYLYDSFLRLL